MHMDCLVKHASLLDDVYGLLWSSMLVSISLLSLKILFLVSSIYHLPAILPCGSILPPTVQTLSRIFIDFIVIDPYLAIN